MDAEGLDLAVLFPSRGLFVLGLDSVEQVGTDGLEPEFATAIARAYNDWMEDFCDVAPDRMFGAGDGRAARRRRRGRSRRAAAWRSSASRRSSSRPAASTGRPWHHPAYDPLWAEIERLDVPISFHGGGQTYLTPDFSLEVLDKLMLWHTFNQPLGIQFVHRVPLRRRRARALPEPARRAARGQLLVGAVAARPPRRALRVDRLVRGARPHDEAVGVLPPQRASRRRGRRGAPRATTSTGSATTTSSFSTDYPHGDSKYPHAVDTFDKLPIPDEAKAKIVARTGRDLYKIPLVKQV